MKIGIQGIENSYHYIAAKNYYEDTVDFVYADNFYDLFLLLSDDNVEEIVCAVENSIYGGINEVYDLLAANKFWINGEIILPIKHCLAATKGSSISEINKVFSHSVAFGQCNKFIVNKLPGVEKINSPDTSQAAKSVAAEANKNHGVICSEHAATSFGLDVIKRDISDTNNNSTRFLVITKRTGENKLANKSSAYIELPHKPGGLIEALKIFSSHSINLSMILSRPIPKRPWEYRFFLDFEISSKNPKYYEVVKELNQKDIKIILLGSYQAAWVD